MKFLIEKQIRKVFNAIGFDLHRLRPENGCIKYLVKSLNHFKINTVLDVGANTGQFAASLRTAGFKGKVISFEPLSGAHEKLCQQAASDPLWLVHPRCALGDSNGMVNINIAANSVSSSILDMLESHSSAAPESVYIGTEQCPVHTLDFVADRYVNRQSPTFLKIDTQGFEWQVLDGAIKTMPYIQGILLEVSLVELYAGQRLWRDFIHRLEKDGYHVWSIDRGFSDPDTGRLLQCDIVFWKSA